MTEGLKVKAMYQWNSLVMENTNEISKPKYMLLFNQYLKNITFFSHRLKRKQANESINVNMTNRKNMVTVKSTVHFLKF